MILIMRKLSLSNSAIPIQHRGAEILSKQRRNAAGGHSVIGKT